MATTAIKLFSFLLKSTIITTVLKRFFLSLPLVYLAVFLLLPPRDHDDDGGLLLPGGGHRAEEGRRLRVHLPGLQLQHDAGQQGRGQAADAP